MSGPFANPNYSRTPPPGQVFWGGTPVPGNPHPGAYPGHGHDGPVPRMPVADWLGNIAVKGAGVGIPGVQSPRW